MNGRVWPDTAEKMFRERVTALCHKLRLIARKLESAADEGRVKPFAPAEITDVELAADLMCVAHDLGLVAFTIRSGQGVAWLKEQLRGNPDAVELAHHLQEFVRAGLNWIQP